MHFSLVSSRTGSLGGGKKTVRIRDSVLPGRAEQSSPGDRTNTITYAVVEPLHGFPGQWQQPIAGGYSSSSALVHAQPPALATPFDLYNSLF